MSDQNTFKLKFWGVRGSIPCPGPDTVRYGGNTTCFEITCGDKRIIIDAGTGIRLLGKHILINEGNVLDADLFFTHTHMDHIAGLPFFVPIYNPKNNLRLYAGHLSPPHDLDGIIDTMLMKDPLFPVPSNMIEQACTFNDFQCGETFEPFDGVVIKTGKLNHPNGACGYRIEYAGKVISICTDTEHFDDGLDQSVISLSRDADVMVYDAAYTDEEYPKYKGWGHSTWQEAIKVAEEANVKKTILFHHDPSHDDDRMDGIGALAAKARPGTEPAVEGSEISP
ncbi:MAG: MBL fold metallo-hydrolase [Opitutales bacterium]